jgi:hypothetical protein
VAALSCQACFLLTLCRSGELTEVLKAVVEASSRMTSQRAITTGFKLVIDPADLVHKAKDTLREMGWRLEEDAPSFRGKGEGGAVRWRKSVELSGGVQARSFGDDYSDALKLISTHRFAEGKSLEQACRALRLRPVC